MENFCKLSVGDVETWDRVNKRMILEKAIMDANLETYLINNSLNRKFIELKLDNNYFKIVNEKLKNSTN